MWCVVYLTLSHSPQAVIRWAALPVAFLRRASQVMTLLTHTSRHVLMLLCRIEDCVIPAGFGYDRNGQITQCPEASYASTATNNSCVRCPAGRTTTPDSTSPSTNQASIDNCFVRPGFGMYFRNNLADPWERPAGTTVPANTTDTTFDVLECPAGYYGSGGNSSNPNTLCLKCAAGFTTVNARSESAADCNGKRHASLSLPCRSGTACRLHECRPASSAHWQLIQRSLGSLAEDIQTHW
jgi:hypothetical protein